MGLAAYIDQQLHPEGLPDPAVDARIAPLTTLSMSASEVAEKYFAPARQAQAANKRQQAAADPNMSPGAATPEPKASPELQAARQNAQLVINELTEAHLVRAVMSERQLNEVLVDFWFNHFNVFAGKGQVRDYLSDYEEDVIRPRVPGSFRDLLGAVAHSPAMPSTWTTGRARAKRRAGDPAQLQRRLSDPRTPLGQRQR